MFGYIYITTNLINGRKYIGKHQYSGPGLDLNYYGSGKQLRCAVKKYGIQNFKVELIETCDSMVSLNEREKFWIDYYNACENSLFYNIAQGGDGGPIFLSLTEEDRKKAIQKRSETWKCNGYSDRMSIKRKQYYKQHPEKCSQISRGLKQYYKLHPEALQKMSNDRKGVKWDAERLKKHASIKGADNKKSKPCLCIETGEHFVSSTAAAEKYGGSYKVIWKCCKGQCETAAGFHWAFVDDIERQNKYRTCVGKPRKIFRQSKIGYKN